LWHNYIIKQYTIMRTQGVLLFLLLAMLMVSCKRQSAAEILYEKSFDDMKTLAGKANKPFCVVLSNTDCPPCSIYVNNLNDTHAQLCADALFDVVDVTQDENRWWQQWLNCSGLPTTVIFTPSGKLSAVVSGAADKCFDCIRSVLKGEPACAAYLYTRQFQSSGDLFPALDAVLNCKFRLEQGENIDEAISNTFDQIVYPYNIYLKCLNEQKQGNHEMVVALAKKLLHFDDAYNVRMYDNLLNEVRLIIDPEYSNPENRAVLAVEKELKLDGCYPNAPVKFKITVKNEGQAPLEISDITVSCSCVKLKSEKKHTIAAGKSADIDFEFTAEHEGVFYREISFVSNDIRAIKTVKMTANVLKQK